MLKLISLWFQYRELRRSKRECLETTYAEWVKDCEALDMIETNFIMFIKLVLIPSLDNEDIYLYTCGGGGVNVLIYEGGSIQPVPHKKESPNVEFGEILIESFDTSGRTHYRIYNESGELIGWNDWGLKSSISIPIVFNHKPAAKGFNGYAGYRP